MNIWKPIAIYCIGYIAGGNKIKKEYLKYVNRYSSERGRRSYDRQWDGTRNNAQNTLTEAVTYSLSEGIKKFTDDILFGDSKLSNRCKINYTNHDEHVDVLLFNTFREARDILHKMKMQIMDKGYVTVADYYSYCNNSWTYEDGKWCWTDLARAYVTRFNNGNFTINFGAKTTRTNPPIQYSNNLYSNCHAENSEEDKNTEDTDEDYVKTINEYFDGEEDNTEREDDET